MSSKSTLRRRRLLQAMGIGATGIIPGLSFFSRLSSAEAAADGVPRVVFFYVGNDSLNPDYWVPEGSGDSFPLTTVHPLMASLQPYADRLRVVGNLGLHVSGADEHWSRNSILTGEDSVIVGTGGYNLGVSLDQSLAEHLGCDSVVMSPGGVSFLGEKTPASTLSPQDAFDLYFGQGGADGNVASQASVLDAAAGQTKRLANRLPKEDVYKLEAHMSAIRELEKKLTKATLDCRIAKAPPATEPGLPFPAKREIEMDVLTQLLACNATQVAVYGVGGTNGFPTPDWGDYVVTQALDVHDAAHAFHSNPNEYVVAQERQTIERFCYDQLAALAAKLDAIPEGDHTLLDNTVIVFVKGMGRGHFTHNELLWMLLGGQHATGLSTGRFDWYGTPDAGRSINDALTGIAQMMGFPTTTFGAPQYNGTPIDFSSPL